LTLAAMSLGYGVVQRDVTVVSTALHGIGASLGGGVSEGKPRPGVAAGVLNATRQTGSVLGVALFGSRLAGRTHSWRACGPRWLSPRSFS
jgi:hypothetical protein